jgi:hypothetical protein
VISGNDGSGILIVVEPASANSIHPDYIGTDVTGTLHLGNGVYGVVVGDSSSNTIGGTETGPTVHDRLSPLTALPSPAGAIAGRVYSPHAGPSPSPGTDPEDIKCISRRIAHPPRPDPPLLPLRSSKARPPRRPRPAASETPAVEPSRCRHLPTPALPATIEIPTPGTAPATGPYDNEWAFPSPCATRRAPASSRSPKLRPDRPAVRTATNLAEKWLDILVTEGGAECSGPHDSLEPPETVSIMGPYNKLDFAVRAEAMPGRGISTSG